MARALELDFESRPGIAPWTQRVIFVAGLALAAFAVTHELEVQRQSRELKARVLAAESPSAAPAAQSRRGGAAPDAREARREAIMRELALPWGKVFAVVERMASPKVTVLALQPDAKAGSVKLVAEAATQNDMLDYVKMLSADQRVARVQLASHEVQTNVPGRPVRFTVIGRLDPE
jgi:hypothetical protein